MAYEFTDDWAEEIAEISTLPEFQTAVVRLIDPSTGNPASYNPDTGKWTAATNQIVYEGPARIIGVRWGVFSGGEAQANAQTISAIRVQFPRTKPDGTTTFFRVKMGCKLFVTSAPRNPVLEELIFTVTSDVQGSSSAARTFEFSLDGDVRKAT